MAHGGQATHAPAAEAVLQGELILVRDGQRVGREAFALAQVEQGYRLSSRGWLSAPDGYRRWECSVHLDDDLSPQAYRLLKAAPGETQVVQATWEGGKAEVTGHRNGQRLSVATFAGDVWTLLDTDVVAHYALLALQLWTSSQREFTALVPQAKAAVPLSATQVGLAALRAPEGGQVARLWRLSLSGIQVKLSTHGGEVLWAEVPAAGVSAWRGDLFAELPVPYHVQARHTELPRGAREKEVRIPTAGIELAGTLLKPPLEAGFPAVLFLAGSGQMDRDGSAPELPARVLRELACSLAHAGFGSLRYDKRGVGASTGRLARASLEDLVDDGQAALDWLMARADVEEVFVVGHSEGAILAPRVTSHRQVAGLVLLGAPARSVEELVVWQFTKALEAMGLHSPA
ncbi:MAG: alpha/beta hydrolase family protein [Candidatus Bipolaricaulaceae bacterium]